MTEPLTAEQIAKLETLLDDFRHRPYGRKGEYEEVVFKDAVAKAAPALIAMAKRSVELEAIKNLALKDWSENSFYGYLQLLGRAEKAEAEVSRYRDMAVKLAGVMHSLVYETNSDEYLVVRDARTLLEKPDIATLLEESSHG